MSLIMSVLYPLFVFLNAYKWYFIIAIVVYIALCMAFKFARQAITVVFGVLAVFFCLSHLPHIYNMFGSLMSDMTLATNGAVEIYTDYVEDHILSDDSLTAAEKLDLAIQYGLSGKPGKSTDELPDSSQKSLKETLNYIVKSTKWGAGIDGEGDPAPGPIDPVPDDESAFDRFVKGAKSFGNTILKEMKELFVG